MDMGPAPKKLTSARSICPADWWSILNRLEVEHFGMVAWGSSERLDRLGKNANVL